MAKSQTVTEYINQAPAEAKQHLREIRSILKKVSPKATESLKWSVPAFSSERVLYIYGGFKHHIGFYPTPSVLKHFKKELAAYKIGKGSVQFSHDKPLPKALITKLAKFRIKELQEKDAKWM